MDQHATGTSPDAKAMIVAALSILKKQRIQLFKMIANSKDNNDQGVTSWAEKAMVAVDARQQALSIFVGMGDAVVLGYVDVLNKLLPPLALPEANDDTIAAYLEQRASHAAQDVEQAEEGIRGHPEAGAIEENLDTAVEESGPAAAAAELEEEEEIVHANEDAEHADGNDQENLEEAPVEESSITPAEESGASGPAHTTNDESTSIASPSARKNRPVKQQGTWSSDYGGVEFLTASPTIIKLKDGSFIELRCDICDGNSSWAHRTMNKGVRGFQSHFRQVHDDKAGVQAILQRCTHRVVHSQEVDQIISGASKIDLIPCKSKVSVGSGVEYVGHAVTGGEISTRRAGHTVESLAAAAIAAANAISGPPSPVTPKKQSRNRDISLPSLTNCLVVVKATDDDGSEKYHELRCDVCHGNGSFGSGKLLEGIKGFKAHFRQIHKEYLSTADIIRRCSHREVPLQEVQEIQSGNVNIGFIKCEGSPNVRPKKSYKDFDNAARY